MGSMAWKYILSTAVFEHKLQKNPSNIHNDCYNLWHQTVYVYTAVYSHFF